MKIWERQEKNNEISTAEEEKVTTGEIHLLILSGIISKKVVIASCFFSLVVTIPAIQAKTNTM